MNDIYVEAFKNQSFKQDGNESAILGIKNYNPPDPRFQHLAIKEKLKNNEVNRVRNGCIIDTLTLVEICEIVKSGGKVIKIYEGVIYRENFMKAPSREVMEKLFAPIQKDKDEKK